jgi:CTP synthase (UTP-ammonia lyase)
MKYILVSGGVISGIGKGVIGSSSPSSSTAPVTATRLDWMLTLRTA